jgi:SpoVK/Ycf46/Vps4 family AAA+-type ATPase
VKSSGQSDAGTTARVFGTFVTWLQEKTQPVFVIATANDVSMLPPELMRKGRFDEIFFVDLPTAEERKQIFEIHLSKKRRDPAQFDINKIVESTAGFSGSEIEQIIISALYDAWDKKTDGDVSMDLTTEGILKSAEEIIPLAFTMKETIDTMRDWAKTRARRASSVVDVKDVTPVRRLEL